MRHFWGYYILPDDFLFTMCPAIIKKYMIPDHKSHANYLSKLLGTSDQIVSRYMFSYRNTTCVC